MNFKKTISYLILSFSLVLNAKDLDTSVIIKNLKLNLFSEIGIGNLSHRALQDYIDRKLSVSILESKGFSDFIFFKIERQIFAIDTNYLKQEAHIYYAPDCFNNGSECCLIYGYNLKNNNFYRLKGGRNNDFRKLYNELDTSWPYWQPIEKINKKTRGKFLEDFWIDEIDMKNFINSLVE